MRQFLRQTLLFSGLFGLTLIVVAFPYAPNAQSNDYLAAIIDKHACMQTSTPPRLVFIGDSNLAFGLDSEAVEKATGKRVCNIALHAGLGLNFVLAEAKDLLRPGDTVVLITAWNLNEGDPAIKAAIQTFSPQAARYAYRDGYWNSLKTLTAFIHFSALNNLNQLQRKFTGIQLNHPDSTSVYLRDGFNRHGDAILHLKDGNTYKRKPPEKNPVRSVNFDTINDFQKAMQSRGVDLFYTFPPYPQNLYNRRSEEFRQQERKLKTDFGDIILGTADTFVFDDSLFYDTEYHLNKEGRARRTAILIELLKISPR